MTTSGPVPIILGLGIPGTPLPPRPPLIPTAPRSHQNVAKPKSATSNMRRRPRRAYGIVRPREDWRAAYGGGRDVLRGGIAKCIFRDYSPVECLRGCDARMRLCGFELGVETRGRDGGQISRTGVRAVRRGRGQLELGKRESVTELARKDAAQENRTVAMKTCRGVSCSRDHGRHSGEKKRALGNGDVRVRAPNLGDLWGGLAESGEGACVGRRQA